MNFLMAVMESVCNSVNAINQQQATDGETTVLDVKLEQNEYNSYMKQLSQDGAFVNYWASKLAHDPGNQTDQAELQAMQAAYQQHQTEMQTNTQQADGATQAEQTQVGQDSTNAANKVQLEAAINQILATLSSALASHY